MGDLSDINSVNPCSFRSGFIGKVVMCFCDVVVNLTTEVARKNGFGRCLCRSSL